MNALTDTNFGFADFDNVVLAGVDLTGANLEGADLRGATHWTPEQLKQANNWDKALCDEEQRAALGVPPLSEQQLADLATRSPAYKQRAALGVPTLNAWPSPRPTTQPATQPASQPTTQPTAE